MDKKSFVCSRCGRCCRPLVLVGKLDISRIKRLGYKESDFVRSDGRHKVLQNDGKCFFLRFKSGKAFCRIYDNRPRICRIYPFFRKDIVDCRPRSLFPSIKEIKKLPV